MVTAEPVFRIANIPVHGALILAPMDGITDFPFRTIARRFGSAISFTEFVNASDVVKDLPGYKKRIVFSENERPVAFQIFDDEPDRILQAALILRRFQPDMIDINMGCPAKTVSGRGAGAGLMRTPRKIRSIFSLLSHALDIPVTGKIRLGWDQTTKNYIEVAKIIEENGGSLISVHGRTRDQGYSGQADWDAIAEIKQAVSIPVIGNGDVRTVGDIDRMMAQTSCDGVMIGRAAMENPWIFSRRERDSIPASEVLALIAEHLAMLMDFYGKEEGVILFRKYLKAYLKAYPISRHDLGAILTTTSEKTVLELSEKVVHGGIGQL